MADGAEELRRLSADLRRTGVRVGLKARRVVQKTATDIQASAKALAPVDTGNLKNSITTTNSVSGFRAEIGPTANYGIFLEMGTSRMPAQPFMGPAADQHAQAFEDAMQQLGTEGLDG